MARPKLTIIDRLLNEDRTKRRRKRKRDPPPPRPPVRTKKSHDRRSHELFTARNRKSGLRRKLLGPDKQASYRNSRLRRAQLVQKAKKSTGHLLASLFCNMNSAARFKRSASLTAGRANNKAHPYFIPVPSLFPLFFFLSQPVGSKDSG